MSECSRVAPGREGRTAWPSEGRWSLCFNGVVREARVSDKRDQNVSVERNKAQVHKRLKEGAGKAFVH